MCLLITVKKKHGTGLKFSNLMNIGKKKTSSLDSPEKSVDTSGNIIKHICQLPPQVNCRLSDRAIVSLHVKDSNKSLYQFTAEQSFSLFKGEQSPYQ